MAILELLALLLFILSSGLLFNERFRHNYFAVGTAGVIGLVSSYFLFETISTRLQTKFEQMVVDTVEQTKQPTPPSPIAAPPIITPAPPTATGSLGVPIARAAQPGDSELARACSDQADAKGLHAEARKKFREECKKNGGTPQ
jgi:hypothetical protein